MTDDLFLLRYLEVIDGLGEERVGLQIGQTIYALNEEQVPSFQQLVLHNPVAEIIPQVLAAKGEPITLGGSKVLKPPITNAEVWAAGVTYKRSEEARELESHNSNI